FCRLLETWRRGEADPSTPNRRTAALRHAADRVEAALAGLEDPLDRYLLELEAGAAEGRAGVGGARGARRRASRAGVARAGGAGVRVSPHRVAVAYLELAVLVRALEGLSAAVRWEASPDRGSLWAGLFDLRENLFDRAQEELRAIAA